MHQSPYASQPVPPFYPPTNPYYMCSPGPPAYHTMYSTPNTSTETHAISPSALQNSCLTSTTPNSYSFYDPYSANYYPTHYNSMASSYTSPNESMNFDA